MPAEDDPTPLLCLASGSPRRRALLKQIGVPHVVRAADIDETALPGESPADYVRRLALGKSLAERQAPHVVRSEEHTSELQSRRDLVCRLLLEKKKKKQ